MPSVYDNRQNVLKEQQAAQNALLQRSKSGTAGYAQANTIQPVQQPAASQRAEAPATQAAGGYTGYSPSQAVLAAQQYLNQQLANKPGAYVSKYDVQLDGLLSEMMHRGPFTYDANADPLYNIYKDLYIQNGRRAMQDTIGNAATLTGGYGSSYAQSAGQQMYNQYMEALNARVPELQQQAYQRYADEGDRMAQSWQMYNTLENQNYNQYRNTVSDWQTERAIAQQAATQAEQFDRQQYQYDTTLRENQRQFNINETFRRDQLAEQARQFDANLAEQIRQANLLDERERNKLAEQARQFDANLAENIRQFDQTLAEDQRQYNATLAENQRQYDSNLAYKYYGTDLDEAYRRDTLAENIRQADLDEAYRRDTLSENIRQADLDEAYRQATLAENVRQYNQNFAEDQRQADLDEAYRQAQLAESIRQYNQNFGEDVRQYDANLAEKQREFDAAQALDQAQYDLTLRKYEDTLAQATGGGNGGNYTPNPQTQQQPAQDQNPTQPKEDPDLTQKNATNFIAGLYTGGEFARRGKGGYDNYEDYLAQEIVKAVNTGKLSLDEADAVIDYYNLNGIPKGTRR